MPADQLLLLALGLVVIAAVAVTMAYATSRVMRRSDDATEPSHRPTGLRELGGDGAAAGNRSSYGVPRSGSLFGSPTSTRQVARVVAFLFLAAVAIVVALSDAWPDTEPAIFTLVAAGTLLVVLFMDMLPPVTLGRWRRPAEGVGAIVFLGLLMALTGGVGSPFFVGFFLVVAGTALSTEGMAPLAIAVVAAAMIALIGFAVSLDEATQVQGLAWIGFNGVALILLADIATAAARAQRHARDEALRASRFDALTGLFTRSFFFTTMEQEVRRSERMGRGFTMLMLDLDDLKPVNDTFGHQWGDRLLNAIADVIRQTIRFTDSAARYGGDEFVVLLPETDAAGGFVVAEKLRRDIASLALRAADRNVRSSVSVGLVSYPDDGATIEHLVAAADIAMYEAKRRGKNRIVGYQTRLERVATAIDVGSAELVQLTPGGEVRTGGDPAPWGGVPARGDVAAPAEWSSGERHSREPGRRAGTELDSGVPPDAGRASSGGGRSRADDEPGAGSREATGQGGGDEGGGRPAGPPPLRVVRREGQHEPGGAQQGRDRSEPDAPWLTRMQGAVDQPGPAGGAPGRGSPEHPATGSSPDHGRQRSDRGEGKGGSRRSEEIREDGERPWVALPIEPYEPPEERGAR